MISFIFFKVLCYMQYLLHYMQYCGGYEPKNCIAGTDVLLLHVYDNDKT